MKLTAKNKKILGYVGLFAALAALAYYLFQEDIKRVLKKQSGAASANDEQTKPGGGTVSQLNTNKLLKKGVKGAEVTELQKRLKKDGGAQLLGLTGPGADGVDGEFGPKTEAALKKVKGVVQITLVDYGRTAGAQMATNTNNTSSNTSPYTEGWLNDR